MPTEARTRGSTEMATYADTCFFMGFLTDNEYLLEEHIVQYEIKRAGQ